ncbi:MULTISPECIES: mercuric ion transporter MerT [unclassified Polaromonas]|uniref:mercuric ion transporter MerT n=1 Tax=unclassified Polaromonas TaxID=2638319 RepID=UPI0018CBE744|nr:MULTISPECIES: mercuric ion transporter MerT [unclassified Polaromonas]MBG6071632.1 mercuric ion transport protein [Polaromonas sp. CG_9.7]MBG6113633.1 mercuric ion transport protein [Polaromonas sp. CG_9.2]MDH6184469.1 mercuric ion transport protein [Polaromonas sp. CG_23.6]
MKKDLSAESSRDGGQGALLSGGLAAILASTCCLGPLVLLTLGVSGAWISNLTLLEPYQPIFIGAAVVSLYFAYLRIWRPAANCAPGQVCALRHINRRYKVLFWAVVMLVFIALAFPLAAPWFY